jgi:polysaccharide deacetylase family protein (PEP-CTERM system associated)
VAVSAGAFVMPPLNESPPAAGRFALSVDVEEYFQVWAFSGAVKRSSWDGFALRADAATRRLLDLFDAADAKATFFVLGWIAERAPGLIREITARGHEIASHGYDHVKVFDQTPTEFRADAEKTKRLIEDAAGAPVRGYRAAGFSIDARTPWAYDILGELGHNYSSSSHPIAHDHYGDAAAPRSAHMRDGVIEAPVATVDWRGRRFSCAGGGWFRAAPYPLFRRMLTAAAATIDGPAIVYLHPWEIDPEQPRISAAPLKSRLRHYLNLTQTEAKLIRLLGDFRWRRVDDCLGLSDRRAAA